MGKTKVEIKGRNVVRESGGNTPFSKSTHFVSISDDDDGSLSGSPRLSQTDPTSISKPKPKGKQLVKPTHRKTQAKNSRTKSPTHVNIPKPPPASPSGSCKPYLLKEASYPYGSRED